MLMLPFLSLSQMDSTDNVRWRLSQKLAEQAAKTVRGQVEELEMVKDQHLTQERYFRAIRGKTGGFFSLPIEGAALIAGLDERDAAALGVCFMELGTLFQIQDDVLDLYGEKGRKQRGADIYEGKPSILVYHHLNLHRPHLRPHHLHHPHQGHHHQHRYHHHQHPTHRHPLIVFIITTIIII